ncbi:hypothetical protein FNYG_05636 [Fusarium nygamai]|uniref:Uncharacterized protein n=1 Tax=Gibberella nygamai TaxID=42673 RepID=A0A2K0WFW8_GIBNY|nr:hypothetical protein FNYG_05636 [Fusarium nygamai]
MIFRPFIAMPRSTRLMSLTSPDSHQKAVYAASMSQLKDLVFYFYDKYPQAAFTTFFNTGLLSMAMQKDAIAAGKAQNLLQGIDQTGEHHTTAEEAFTSFIFDPISDRVAEAQVHAMADKFEEMVVFDELIDKNTTS